MAANKIICTTNNVEYITIRKAMINGARTVEEVAEQTGVCTTCEGCKTELPVVLSSVCGCKKIPLQSVVDAVQNGANTVEEIGEITGAGTGCGRCKALIQNVIELGR